MLVCGMGVVTLASMSLYAVTIKAVSAALKRPLDLFKSLEDVSGLPRKASAVHELKPFGET